MPLRIMPKLTNIAMFHDTILVAFAWKPLQKASGPSLNVFTTQSMMLEYYPGLAFMMRVLSTSTGLPIIQAVNPAMADETRWQGTPSSMSLRRRIWSFAQSKVAISAALMIEFLMMLGPRPVQSPLTPSSLMILLYACVTVLYLRSFSGFLPSPWNRIFTTSVGLATNIPNAPVVKPAAILQYMGIICPSYLSPTQNCLTGSQRPILKLANTIWRCNPAESPLNRDNTPSSAAIVLTQWSNPLYLLQTPWTWRRTLAVSKGMVRISAMEAATPPESIMTGRGRLLGEYLFSILSNE